ncbi:WYL domain-containing protein [Actinacidiphila sp. ITFR-21]|uniref:WYL domain-containing protein n=1 Tax=Actinacidiphila sp. ITFR-21 TaxID=3075199 RepID=UPI00288BB24E|nr:WYL domain-containing protein [Streptomyces sp. ITFR-21]WNI19228.1 WYL domain-containing protein [Streptomyces sp. ITFR-21]
MARTLRTIRRTIRAAMSAGRALVTAVRGARFTLLVRLFTAIDQGATVRIAYTDSKGVASVRDITPHRLDTTAAGNITCRAFDHRDGEDTTFRADRMTTLEVG